MAEIRIFLVLLEEKGKLISIAQNIQSFRMKCAISRLKYRNDIQYIVFFFEMNLVTIIY